MFDRFFQAESHRGGEHGGAGLGLTLAGASRGCMGAMCGWRIPKPPGQRCCWSFPRRKRTVCLPPNPVTLCAKAKNEGFHRKKAMLYLKEA